MSLFEQRKAQCLTRIDKSMRGQVDKEIAPLVKLINSRPCFYTTSSCAGRILIQATGKRKCDTLRIFVTHKKTSSAEIRSHLTRIRNEPCWFRQESFIIHVCSRDITAAIALLNAARESGIKRSGIISAGERIVVQIEGTEHMDVPVSERGELLVDNAYLSCLARTANMKMDLNSKRMKKFKEKIKLIFS